MSHLQKDKCQINDYIPENFHDEDLNTDVQTWLRAMSEPLCGVLADIRRFRDEHVIWNMTCDYMLENWFRTLSLPLSGTEEEKQALLFTYLAGTENTRYYVKLLVSQTLGVDYDQIEIFQLKEIFPFDPILSHWYWPIVSSANADVNAFDLASLLAAIRRIHPLHCELGGLVVGIEPWEWDNPALPLDDIDFYTGYYKLCDEPTFQLTVSVPQCAGPDTPGGESPDGNQFMFDLFIESLCPAYPLYGFAEGGLTLNLAGGENIVVGGYNFNIANNFASPAFVPFNGIALLYCYVDTSVTPTLEFGIAYEPAFTPGDPLTYFGQHVTYETYGLLEVTLTGATTDIAQADIKDVRVML